MTILDEKIVKIRKPRRCFGCLNICTETTQMNVQTNVSDGEIYHVYECLICNRIAKHIKFDDGLREEGWFRDALDSVSHDFRKVIKLYNLGDNE